MTRLAFTLIWIVAICWLTVSFLASAIEAVQSPVELPIPWWKLVVSIAVASVGGFVLLAPSKEKGDRHGVKNILHARVCCSECGLVMSSGEGKPWRIGHVICARCERKFSGA